MRRNEHQAKNYYAERERERESSWELSRTYFSNQYERRYHELRGKKGVMVLSQSYDTMQLVSVVLTKLLFVCVCHYLYFLINLTSTRWLEAVVLRIR